MAKDLEEQKKINFENLSKIEILKHEKENFENFFDNEKKENSILKNNLSEEAEKVKKLELENIQMKTKLDIQNSDFKKLSENNTLLNEKSTEFTIYKAELDQRIKYQDDEIRLQKGEIADLAEKVRISEDILMEKEGELIELRSESDQLRCKIEEILMENKNLR